MLFYFLLSFKIYEASNTERWPPAVGQDHPPFECISGLLRFARSYEGGTSAYAGMVRIAEAEKLLTETPMKIYCGDLQRRPF